MSDLEGGSSQQERSTLTDKERKLIASLANVVKRHHRMIGTKADLERSVSEVVAGAVAGADPADQNRLADTLTPAIVRCVRQEIRNSRHELVESLYPMMGRLISAYAANASRDLIYQVDQRLASVLTGRYLRLRVKSWIEGIPYKELALVEAFGLKIHDLLLINRRTGECLDRWHANADQAMGTANDRLFAGMLSAIAEFSREALNDDKGELREVNFGNSRVFLRVTPSFLVAARCFGKGGRVVEARLDRALRSFLETHAETLRNALEATPRQPLHVLPELAETLNSELQPRPGEYGYRERGPVFAVGFAALCIVLGLGSVGNYAWQRAQAAEMEHTVRQVIREHDMFLAFPIDVDAPAGGDEIILTGTAPTFEVIEKLVTTVESALEPTVKVVSNIVLAPVSDTLSYTVESVSGLARTLGDIHNALSRQLISPTHAVLAGPVADTLVRRGPSGPVLSGAVWGGVSERLSNLAATLERLPETGTRGELRSVRDSIKRQVDLLKSREQDIRDTLRRAAHASAILPKDADLVSGDQPAASRSRQVLREVSANLGRLTTTLRKVLSERPPSEPGWDGNWTTAFDANGVFMRAEPDLAEYSPSFEKDIDWNNVRVPQMTIENRLEAVASDVAAQPRGDSRSSAGLPVRLRPFIVMPGVGRLDLSQSLGTVTSGALDGTAGPLHPTTGAPGDTVGGTMGGVSEGVGAALGEAGQGVSTATGKVGQDADAAIQ